METVLYDGYGFCVSALEEAIRRYGRAWLISIQDSQIACAAFTNMLRDKVVSGVQCTVFDLEG